LKIPPAFPFAIACSSRGLLTVIRYLQAALSLPYNKAEMHYAIAKTLLRHWQQDAGTTTAKRIYVKSQHICAAADLLKDREKIRAPYRVILAQAAEHASDSGARSTAVFYWTHCIKLLGESPWDSSKPDVNYQETLTLYTRTAETYWYVDSIIYIYVSTECV
jgi:predicted ATPase